MISNFDEILAGKSPDYLVNILLAFLMNWWPEKLPPEIVKETIVVVSSSYAEVARQAQVCGLKKIDEQTYSIPLGDLAKLVEKRRDLTEAAQKRGGLKSGFWMRYQLMSELYGL